MDIIVGDGLGGWIRDWGWLLSIVCCLSFSFLLLPSGSEYSFTLPALLNLRLAFNELNCHGWLSINHQPCTGITRHSKPSHRTRNIGVHRKGRNPKHPPGRKQNSYLERNRRTPSHPVCLSKGTGLVRL
ncbi:hypothetical protein BO70DRAFT_104701 [Aspergillus heteromorphus CBS 117.55]|uniref:Uncharacterized protein n=1 Tax=Aspergillus heteromorphus CBS 117.55 TaxID=1448321 RepID=A0A317VMM3_9EURO|nr:uncharacterized protein BO70DRAFT_104701 [Aspergillus heteromorphus CBS 117.55]PWY74337.1 hypothetical protein BO70DRAFT_104701 [Aspergillus heteromorphus CBS 117.55]